MPDICRFGLPLAALIAVGGALLLIALTPAPVAPANTTPPAEHHVTTTPHDTHPQEDTTDA